MKDLEQAIEYIKNMDLDSLRRLISKNSVVKWVLSGGSGYYYNLSASDLPKSVDLTNVSTMQTFLNKLGTRELVRDFHHIYDSTSDAGKKVIEDKLINMSINDLRTMTDNMEIVKNYQSRGLISCIEKVRNNILAGATSRYGSTYIDKGTPYILFGVKELTPLTEVEVIGFMKKSKVSGTDKIKLLGADGVPKSLQKKSMMEPIIDELTAEATKLDPYYSRQAVSNLIDIGLDKFKIAKDYTLKKVENVFGPNDKIYFKMMEYTMEKSDTLKGDIKKLLGSWQPKTSNSYHDFELELLKPFMTEMYKVDNDLFYDMLSVYLQKKGSMQFFGGCYGSSRKLKVDCKKLLDKMTNLTQRTIDALSRCETENVEELEPYMMGKVMSNFAEIRNGSIYLK